jgi:xanthine/uracil permease
VAARRAWRGHGGVADRLLITPVFSRITKFFPPLVTGIVITTIGLTLMPVAARWAMGGNSASPEFGSMANIGLAR